MIFIVSLCIKFQFNNPNLFFISLPKNIFSVIDRYGLKLISEKLYLFHFFEHAEENLRTT